MRVDSGLLRGLALLSMFFGVPSDVEAQIQVDVALVLAVDVSYSVDPAKSALQREGYIDAFRSLPVAQAILSGPLGRIAVAYVEWAGESHQRVLIPWAVVDSQAASLAFADALASHPLRQAPGTSISGAIDFSTSLFEPTHIEAMRRVIDISGDGANNDGRPVADARDDAVASGYIINGLPIEIGRLPGEDGLETLNPYFRDCVIGGLGAFTVPVVTRSQFGHVIRTKLIREISSENARELILKTDSGSPVANCLAGEIFTLEHSLPNSTNR
jgi:hypothetical protein